jgi:UDP-N-acetylmuramoylalanine--D-glutamate ligase
MKVSELKVTGLHNAANALAALALCRAIGLPTNHCRCAIQFQRPPHPFNRLQINRHLLRRFQGTNAGATVAA